MTAEPDAVGDFHNHLVPGVDDGSGTLDDALEGVGRMAAAGIRAIITTPHIEASLLGDAARAEAYLDRVSDSFDEVLGEVTARFDDVELRRGHEVRMDLPECDFSDERLRLGGTSFALVEWARFQVPPGSVEVLSRIRAAGVRPVVAHPERYAGVDGELALVREWKRVGAYLQVNYGSLVGRYGREVQAVAFSLLGEGLADYFSTDFHGRPGLRLYRNEASRRLEALGAEEQLHMLSVTNPQRLFRDEAPLAAPPLSDGRGFWGRLREIFP